MENFWRTDICGLDLDYGEEIIFVTKDGCVHIGHDSTRWEQCCIGTDPETGEKQYDECGTTCIENDNYETWELEDIVAWCYLEDLYKFPLPDGVKIEPVELSYKRFGKSETRTFSDKQSAKQFKKRLAWNDNYKFEDEQ